MSRTSIFMHAIVSFLARPLFTSGVFFVTAACSYMPGVAMSALIENSMPTIYYIGKPYNPFFAIGDISIVGPMYGRVTFNKSLTNGSMLTHLDVTDFEFRSDGLIWDNASTFISMKFQVGTSLLPIAWEVVLEKELLGGNTGIEELVSTTPGLGLFREAFDEVVLGDGSINNPYSGSIDGKGINLFSPGIWVVPEPRSLAIFVVCSMVLLFVVARSKT